MNDYMRALHQRFFQEPDCTEIRRELEALRLTLRDKLDRQDRETLLKLTDLALETREDVSLASFTAGTQLALGIAGEQKAGAVVLSGVAPNHPPPLRGTARQREGA